MQLVKRDTHGRTASEKRQISQDGAVVAVPKAVHKESRTYKGGDYRIKRGGAAQPPRNGHANVQGPGQCRRI